RGILGQPIRLVLWLPHYRTALDNSGGHVGDCGCAPVPGSCSQANHSSVEGGQNMAATRSPNTDLSRMPPETLEVRAADERRRLQSSVEELRWQVRERLDVKKIARQYVPAASAVAALIGLGAGYGFAGIFTRR